MPTPLTDADKVLRNDTGIDIATNIASIASALTPSNITDLGDVNLTNPITDGQVIKYDTATQKWVNGLGNITMECTQAQYDAWKQSGQLKTNTLYVITDAPNLNATAQDISYDGGADTVWDKVEGKQAQIIYNLVAYDDFTSSTTFSYIGKSLTAPTGHCYIVKARLSYINSAPQEIGASRSNSNSDVYQCYARTDKSAEITFILASGETAYFWAKYNGATTNKILIAVVDITL